VFKRIIDILANELGRSPEAITPNTDLKSDLGINSLDLMNIILVFEESFGICISDDDVKRLDTVADLVSYVETLAPVGGAH